ncbi:MAG TPA: MDR family MFS transporter [Mycobacteriales bacterium]|nr:MDR family MFS transporter [Mycobacteriales bacterium]
MTTAAPPAPGGADSHLLSHRQILTILSGLLLGMFLAALDQTVVATGIRVIADNLHGYSLQAWATTAFLITSTITTPLYGKLSDQYGRKPFFMGAITIFITGSALCGLSQSMYELAAFRAIQGLGAGGLFTLALAIIGDLVGPRERARYQGYFLAVFGTASVLGPVVGGFLAGQASVLGITGWRWIFWINVPIGMFALLVVSRVLQVQHVFHKHRIDWQGALSLVIALVPLLTVAEQGRSWGWGSGRALACYIVGVIGIVLFFLAERACGEDALLPLRMFRNKTFRIGGLSSVVIGMGMFGGLLMLPQYLQVVKGASPTTAGLETLPMTIGMMTGSIISGQTIARTARYKIFPVVGTALMVVAMVLFHFVSATTPLWQVMIVMLVMGLGLGGNMQPVILAVQNAVAPREIGVATSSVTFSRQMGGTLGTAVFLSILFSVLADHIRHALQAAAQTGAWKAAAAAHPAQLQLIRSGGSGHALNDTSFIQKLDPVLAAPFKTGFAQSMDLVFLVAAVIVAVGFIIIWQLPELPLRMESGNAARMAERQKAAADEGIPATVPPQDAVPASSDDDVMGIPSAVAPDAVAPGSTPR